MRSFPNKKPSRNGKITLSLTDIRIRRLLRAFSIAAFPVAESIKVYFSRVFLVTLSEQKTKTDVIKHLGAE